MSDIDEAVRNGWLHKDAEDEIARLRAERDALAKDAARYRWLKSVYFTPGKSAFALVGPTRSASELDATIDAAMAEEARTRKQS